MSGTCKPHGVGRILEGVSLERFATTARADFRFAPLNVLLMVALFVVGLLVHLSVYAFSVHVIVFALVSAMLLAAFVRESPRRPASI